MSIVFVALGLGDLITLMVHEIPNLQVFIHIDQLIVDQESKKTSRMPGIILLAFNADGKICHVIDFFARAEAPHASTHNIVSEALRPSAIAASQPDQDKFSHMAGMQSTHDMQEALARQEREWSSW